MPILRRRHEHPEGRRLVRDGDEYTIDDEDAGRVELDHPPPHPDPPPEETRGEPWGWTKPGPRPRGHRDDARYGPRNPDDPGPYDGAWEPPGGGALWR